MANPMFSPLLYSLSLELEFLLDWLISVSVWMLFKFLNSLLLLMLLFNSHHGSQLSLFFKIKLVFGVEESLLSVFAYLYTFLFVESKLFILVILEGVLDELYLLEDWDGSRVVETWAISRLSILLEAMLRFFKSEGLLSSQLSILLEAMLRFFKSEGLLSSSLLK